MAWPKWRHTLNESKRLAIKAVDEYNLSDRALRRLHRHDGSRLAVPPTGRVSAPMAMKNRSQACSQDDWRRPGTSRRASTLG
jgi:hypothetical protein